MSAEWTPTTDQVRKPFFLAGNGDAFDRWFAGEIRKAKAVAWLEGYEWADSYFPADDPPRYYTDNPYEGKS